MVDLSQYSIEELNQLYKEVSELPEPEQSGFNKQHPLITDFGVRTVAPILGGALGTPGGPLGVAAGAGLGAIGGNLASGYLTNKPASKIAGDTATDLAFLAVPSAVRGSLGLLKNTKKAVPLGQFTTDTLNAFKNTGVDVLPTQISDGLGSNFKSLNPQGYEQAADFFVKQADQISDATRGLTGKIGDIGADFTSSIGDNLGKFQQGVNNLYNVADTQFGDATIAGTDLYRKGLRLGKGLLKSNPVAANEVTSFTRGTLRPLLDANHNALTGQSLDDINKLINNELKQQFVDPSKNKTISGYDDINKVFSGTLKTLESKLNPTASVSRGVARNAYRTQQELLQHLKDIGGADVEQLFNAGFRSPAEFSKMAKSNPDLIIDTFLKSSTPKETLDVLTQLGGKEIKPYLSNKLASKVLNSLDDVTGGVNNTIEDVADPTKLVKNADKYYGALEALGGTKFAQGILDQAKQLAKVKYYTRGNPKMLASRVSKQLGNEATTGNLLGALTGATKSALGLNLTGVASNLSEILPKAGSKGALNILDYTTPEAIELLSKGYKPTSVDVLRYQTELNPGWTALQGAGIGLDYGITQRRY